MLKRIVLFFSILCAGLILNSCSESLDRTSSVSFKLSDSFFREALKSSSVSISDSASTAKEYMVKVSVIWDKGNRFNKNPVTFDDEGKIVCPEFTFEDLPAGKTVKIDVSISCDGTVIYSMEKPVEQELKAGANECSVTLEKQVADVAISIENKDSLTLGESYKLVVEITDSSNKTARSEYPIDETNVYTIAQNKTIGETLKIEVSVYNNNLCLYKTLEPVSATVAKENNINVTLCNAVSTAAVWQNRTNDGSVDTDTYYLFQNKAYDTEAEKDSFASCITYTFSADGKLVALNSIENNNDKSKTLKFSVYELNLDTLIYDTDPANDFTLNFEKASSVQIIDIYCDSGYLYILKEDTSTNLYSVTKYLIEKGTSDEITIYSEDSKPYCTALAVKDDMVVVSSSTESMPEILYKNFNDTSVYFNKVPFSLDISLSDDAELVVTDLQFGDGFGNDTDKLYALVRNAPDFSKPGNITEDTVVNVHSSGALVEINLENYAAPVLSKYGYKSVSERLVVTKCPCLISSPGATSKDTSNFYGPYKFAALSPKKLVILDDGICVTTDDNKNNKFANNDALFEFDIATKALKRGADVTASVPSASGFDVAW